MDNSVETVTAAANAIVAAESRVQQVTVPRKRLGACFSMYWCFGSQKHENRIGHAVLVPEPTRGADAPAPQHSHHPPASTLPFVVPPSSPASFLQSEPPSATQSPAGFMSFSANAYSPSGPSSIFAIGPYANELQLVSPPVFSTFTTEPSTAPVTPPPESIQLTTPSSPEVPMAKLLSSFNASHTQNEAYEFQSYQLYPGSPIGHLISPSSVSGASTPFPDPDIHASGGGYVPTFLLGEPPEALTGDDLVARKRVPRANGPLVDGENAAAAAALSVDSGTRTANDEAVMGHRVSFELTSEEVTRCMEKKPALPSKDAPDFARDATNSMSERNQLLADEIYHDIPEELRRSASASATKEFKFNNADGADVEPGVGSDWWVQGNVIGAETTPQEKWAFFPMIQPGVS